MKTEILLSGSGGQGIITAAIIYAKAAALFDKNVIQSQSYGPEARGGASKSEVIISDYEIYHPHVINPKYMLALTQQAADKYYSQLDKDGILIIDETLIHTVPDVNHIIKIPFMNLTLKNFNKLLFMNIVALGFLTKIIGQIPYRYVKTAVSNSVPENFIDINLQALELGYNLG